MLMAMRAVAEIIAETRNKNLPPLVKGMGDALM